VSEVSHGDQSFSVFLLGTLDSEISSVDCNDALTLSVLSSQVSDASFLLFTKGSSALSTGMTLSNTSKISGTGSSLSGVKSQSDSTSKAGFSNLSLLDGDLPVAVGYDVHFVLVVCPLLGLDLQVSSMLPFTDSNLSKDIRMLHGHLSGTSFAHSYVHSTENSSSSGHLTSVQDDVTVSDMLGKSLDDCSLGAYGTNEPSFVEAVHILPSFTSNDGNTGSVIAVVGLAMSPVLKVHLRFIYPTISQMLHFASSDEVRANMW